MEQNMKTVGLTGAGRMGLPIIGHLCRAGFRVLVSERNPERRTDIESRGAAPVELDTLASQAEAILICVGYDSEVRELICYAGGLLDTACRGTIIAMLSTIHPKTLQELPLQADARGLPGAQAASLQTRGIRQINFVGCV